MTFFPHDGAPVGPSGKHAEKAVPLLVTGIILLLAAVNYRPGLGPYPAYLGRDLDCQEIGYRVRVSGPDPHRLDADGDGVGCESQPGPNSRVRVWAILAAFGLFTVSYFLIRSPSAESTKVSNSRDEEWNNGYGRA